MTQQVNNCRNSEVSVASTIRIPTVLRAAVGGQSSLSTSATTVGEALAGLVVDHPAVEGQLFNPDGSLHRFLNVYVNDDDVRYTGGLSTPVGPGDEITLLPAVAGGAIG